VLITIDTQNRRPIYQQIADGIRTLIAGGDVAEGQPLPPVRQLAADLGVNLNTVAAAYRDLQGEGLILVKHGARAVVAPRDGIRQDDGELRLPLRNVLAQMVLAKMPRGEILSVVSDELYGLLHGSES
jgi:GntR family transcriptional regulator